MSSPRPFGGGSYFGLSSLVAQCLKIAHDLAGRDENAQARVQAYASRFADPSITAGTLRIEP